MSTTRVTFLLDRSSSMNSILDSTIEAFNGYLDGIRPEKSIRFSLVQFDTISLDKTCVNVPAKDAPKLSRKNFVPRGSTPLIDAACKTIHAVAKVAKPDEKIVICIQTDGEENSSVEFTWNDLNALIKEKTMAGWEFNFMGAGIDAYQQAKKMGLSSRQTVSYNSSDTDATNAIFRSRAVNTVLYASGASATMDFMPSEKLAAGDAYDPDSIGTVPVTSTAPHRPNIGAKRKAPIDPKPAPLVDDLTL